MGHEVGAVLMAAVASCALVAGGASTTRPATAAATQASCRPVVFEGPGEPEALVVVDLPLSGRNRYETRQMAGAVEFMLERAGFAVRGRAVGLRVCDDATAARGAWDERRCLANARAHASDERVLAVVGPYNSGCAALQMPVTNDAGLALVSPVNTYPCLTVRAPGCDPTEPRAYQPTGPRTYARVTGNDYLQARALVASASREGARRLYVLHDGGPYGSLIAQGARAEAARLGLDVVGLRAYGRAGTQALLDDIRASGADAIVVGGLSTSPGGARLLREKASVLGPRPSFYLSDGFATTGLLSAVGARASAGLLAVTPTLPVLEYGASGTALVRDFARWRGVPARKVALYVPPALQTAELVLEALAASDFTRRSVRNALFRIRSRGTVFGHFRITATGDPAPVVFGTYRPRGGRWNLVGEVRLR